MIKQTVFVTLALCALFSVTVAQAPLCERLARKCDFYLKGYRSMVPVLHINGKPDKSIHGKMKAIMSKRPSDRRVHVVNSNGKSAEFVFKFRTWPIVYFGSPKFTPTHFKPYTIENTTYSGIGHQTFTGTQRKFAAFRCVRVYITEYQSVGANGKMMNKVNKPPTDNDCIVFKTR